MIPYKILCLPMLPYASVEVTEQLIELDVIFFNVYVSLYVACKVVPADILLAVVN